MDFSFLSQDLRDSGDFKDYDPVHMYVYLVGLSEKLYFLHFMHVFRQVNSSHLYFTIRYTISFFRECVRFCFMRVIQAELDRVAQHWNLHRICSQHNVESPSGRPDTLFFLPELKGDFIYNLSRKKMHTVGITIAHTT